MKDIRINIGVKLISAFAFLSIIIIVSGIYLFYITKQYKNNIEHNKSILIPSISQLDELRYLTSKSNELILLWVYVEKERNTKSKNKLDNIINYQLPDILAKLEKRKTTWDKKTKEQFNLLSSKFLRFMSEQSNIMLDLETKLDYEDIVKLQIIKSNFGTNNELTKLSNDIIKETINLIKTLKLDYNNRQQNLIDLYKRTRFILYALLSVLIIIFSFIIFLVVHKIIKPIKSIRESIYSLSKGILEIKPNVKQIDEIGDISKGINQFTASLIEIANFSKELGNGNFNTNYTPLSSDDLLGNSLISTKENLQETEKLRKQNEEKDRQRSWQASGLAKFSDILRSNSNNLEELSYNLISEMIGYLEINIGAIFLYNDKDKTDIFLELVASYAYKNEQKERKIKPGETLVGQCFIERETVYINDVPKNYLTISSGLGDEKPASILLCPLKYEDHIFGVIELASFSEFESYKIDFVEKISESIANTISNLKTSKNTEKLLHESQMLTEQLSSQEEEMRQTMEEMQASQEELEMKREHEKSIEEKLIKENEAEIKTLRSELNVKIEIIENQNIKLKNTFNAINNSIGTAHFSLDGDFICANPIYLEYANISENELIGKNLSHFMNEQVAQSKSYAEFWDNLKKGEIQSGGHQYFFNNKEVWLYETFTPIRNNKDDFYEVIALCNDISNLRRFEEEQKLLIKDLQKKLNK